MCPMRIFLVLFSAILASYLAWRNFKKSESVGILDVREGESEAFAEKLDDTSYQMSNKLRSGFWTFVDMATGRYLWKNLRPKPAEGIISR